MMSRSLFVALGTLWVAGLLAGLRIMLAYEYSAGDSGRAVDRWPADSSLTRGRDCWTLVLFVHPRCPCTRATIEEVARILGQFGRRAATYIVVLAPHGQAANWSDTDIRAAAELLDGGAVVTDVDGRKAMRFGARTSGDAFLYDVHGILCFHGGITGSRGHVGDNAGAAAVTTLLSGGKAIVHEHPVFGCPLFAPAASLHKVRE